MIDDLRLEPDPTAWRALLDEPPAGRWRGVEQAAWRAECRRELGLPADRPVVATGHQTLLWHPGILVKYLAAGALAATDGSLAAAALIVDQHTGPFGVVEVPVRTSGGVLGIETITLTPHRDGVPMVRHPAFEAPPPPAELAPALPSVGAGITRIVAAVNAHRDRPDAARQMAAALDELMSPWVEPRPGIGSSDLMATGLTRALLEEMAGDPRRCAACYNAAVRATPEAGIGPLGIGDRVELPLWKIAADDRRVPADDADVRAHLEGRAVLLPRALMLTLLVRLGMCDLFVHGTGGAVYDRAMERWSVAWLGLTPGPRAVATADVRLDLGGPGPVDVARRAYRRAWHDPPGAGEGGPSPAKAELLAAIGAAPRRSPRRREAFLEMHRRLGVMRDRQQSGLAAARATLESAVAAAPIAGRRDWAFPLYPRESLDTLAGAVTARFAATAAARSSS